MVTSERLYLGFLLLLGLERVGELFLSLRHARAARAAGAIEAGRGHYPVMVAFHSLFLVSCALEVVLGHRPFPGLLGWTALGVALAAQALRYWAVATLGVRWNTRVLVWPGLAPVTAGPYRFVRHPNYLAVVVEMVAVPLVHGAWVTAAVFSAGNALLLRTRIRSEEQALGRPWAEAFAHRPRLVPELPRGK
ncbi:MAG TPA: isoprenylcysteine carboxylmethyltransferase family protein [Myxococcaceae bacterium]|jgi:methyltransferase|nr:isoprenylcysteine carboxylmethyltransferase family protein [Myxococcaceae bacterium]